MTTNLNVTNDHRLQGTPSNSQTLLPVQEINFKACAIMYSWRKLSDQTWDSNPAGPRWQIKNLKNNTWTKIHHHKQYNHIFSDYTMTRFSKPVWNKLLSCTLHLLRCLITGNWFKAIDDDKAYNDSNRYASWLLLRLLLIITISLVLVVVVVVVVVRWWHMYLLS